MHAAPLLVLSTGFVVVSDFTNGAHDDTIAAGVATKVFTWRQAVVSTAVANLVGASHISDSAPCSARESHMDWRIACLMMLAH